MSIWRIVPLTTALGLLTSCVSDPNRGYIERANSRLAALETVGETSPPMEAAEAVSISKYYSDRPDLLALGSHPDVQPRLSRHVIPHFPAGYRIPSGTYTVVMIFMVGKDGKVIEPRPGGTFHQAFVKNARAALKKWRFTPAKKDGKPVEVWSVVPFVYTNSIVPR